MSDTYNKKNTKKYTYFVTGGGTGGHIYPAIAVCNELKKDETTKEIFYIGNPDNLEFEIVNKLGYKFLGIKVSGMPRKPCCGLISWFLRLQCATFKAMYYIFKYKPDVIFGTGGYVSAPAIFAGNMTNTPIVIHDSDAQPGIVSRYTAPMAKCVSLAFEGAKKFIKSQQVHVNGNPIRAEFNILEKSQARKILGLDEKLTICVMGGSQGAETINSAFIPLIPELLAKDIQIVFQTGKKNWEKAISQLKEVCPDFEKQKNLVIKPYFDDMVAVLKSCDIAVSRAGSLSLSEICACGIATILIPYPHAAADHQRKNARFMEERRAALYLENDDTTSVTLKIALDNLLDNSDKLKEIQKNALNLAKIDATARIISQLKEAMQK